MKTVLFSPVCTSPAILRETLPDWFALRGVDEIWVYDDNKDPESSEILKKAKVKILPAEDLLLSSRENSEYSTDEITHRWTKESVKRVTQIKDFAIYLACQAKASLFLIDADVAPHPNTVAALAEESGYHSRATIVGEVFWTQWAPGQPYLPNAWTTHPYNFKGPDSLIDLAVGPQIQHVGGIGACTYIPRSAMEKGLSFKPIVGIPDSWWEDRTFCIRAAAKGVRLLASTTHPPFHIYRESMIPECQDWKKAGRSKEWFLKHWLTGQWQQQVRAILQ